MVARVLPIVLVAFAAIADAAGAHRIAFYLLLGAVPAVATAGLVCLGEVIDRRRDGGSGLLPSIHGLLCAIALVLLLAGEAARGAALQTRALPALGSSALLACLGVFALQCALSAALALRRLTEPEGRRDSLAGTVPVKELLGN